MRNRSLIPGGLVVAFLACAPPARACGGCFQSPAAVDSVVTGHRMAFAVSASRTVLWDQIKYTGNPADFGWVLPVAPGATLELSSDAWFESLETATSTEVTPPTLNCISNNSSGLFGCGASDSYASSPQRGSDVGGIGPSVIVLHEASIGPYETVTLQSSDSAALRNWLSMHGYVIGPDIDPIIEDYISEGMNFIALKLSGSKPMQPVRVTTPSGKAVLPLRMVAAGTGALVDIVLYVIGEKRLGLSDLTEVSLDLTKLSFDFNTSQTNYGEVRTDALGDGVGANFLTTFSAPHPFNRSFTRALSTSSNTRIVTTLSELYFAQGFEDAQMAETGCTLAETGLANDDLVEDQTAASRFTCGPLDDISAALLGMHPSRIWLSRLEMNLPHEALSMDCRIDDTVKQVEVSSDLKATLAKNRPSYCLEPLFESRIARERTSPALAFAWAMVGALVIGLARRARRRY
jgi:hypothetical protein